MSKYFAKSILSKIEVSDQHYVDVEPTARFAIKIYVVYTTQQVLSNFN